jgi:hypothetical protein
MGKFLKDLFEMFEGTDSVFVRNFLGTQCLTTMFNTVESVPSNISYKSVKT